MNKFCLPFLLLLFLLSSCGVDGQLSSVEKPLSIPYNNKIVVDGNKGDWDSTGLIIPLISNLYGEINLEDYAAELKLAWDDQNLYFIADIEDDMPFEMNSPLLGDGIEIFISREKGSNKMVQYIISPGITEKFRLPRVNKFDYVSNSLSDDVKDLTLISVKTEKGYRIEGKIPMEKTGLNPAEDSIWALNVYLSDVDPEKSKTRHALYFNQDTYDNHSALQSVKFDKSTGVQLLPITIKAFIEDRSNYMIRFLANRNSEQDEVVISDDFGYRKVLKMEQEDGFIRTGIDIPLSDIDPSTRFFKVEFGEEYTTFLYFRDFSNRYVNTEKPNRFESEIILFEEKDKLNFPPENSVLFIGSSSIRLWESTISEDFKGVNVICRGFGGSTTGDALYYFDRIVAPYKPSVLIMAEGSNDLGRGDSPREVVELTRKFIEKAAEVLPGTRVIIMSIKVSVTRKSLVETVKETNDMLQEMIAGYDNAEYLDVVTEMMTSDGRVRSEIFSADSTHMNTKGYEIWTHILCPVLEEYKIAE